MAIIPGVLTRNAVRTTIIAGGAAGDHTVTGIKTRDTLISVLRCDFRDASLVGVNDTAEYTISAANTINNAGGTASTTGYLIVTYLSAT